MIKINLKNILAIAALLATGVVTSSCDLLEYPHCEDEEQPQSVHLQLVFETEWDVMTYEYTRADNSALAMNYVIHAYPLTNGAVNPAEYTELTFSRDLREAEAVPPGSSIYDCETTIELTPGEYRIMAWADLEVDGKEFYNSTDFRDISVNINPYTGDTDLRDAFAGSIDITNTRQNAETAEERALPPYTSVIIPMQRPLAKYTFIATDAEEFLAMESENTGRTMTIDDYYVTVSYPQFMPSAYNMMTERPSDSQTGISFDAVPTMAAEGEANMGFDYVFVNHNDAKVNVSFAVYAKEDNRLAARTGMITVPLKRDFNTLVYGAFLLRKESGGVGINPGFDGEYNLFAPLTPG